MDSKLLVKASKPKPLLRLKDYLLDDLSSCSSSGFRTFPRQQCCTTVRFLLEIDMKNKQPMSSSSSTRLSAFQKASEVILTAVKNLGLTVVKSTSSQKKNNTKIATLSRSLSRKLIKKGFWKKNNPKEIGKWKSSVEKEEKEEEEKSGPSNCSTSDDINGNGRRVGVTVGDDRDSMDVTTSTNSGSTNSTNSKKSWINEEKEQFSPVSVLDCPFDDEDEVCSSPFQHRLSHDEGTKKKLMRKLRKFERLAQLEPVNLENRLAMSECDQESIQSAHLHSNSKSSLVNLMLETEEEKPLKLLELIKATMPSSEKLNADKLLLDFFNERLNNEQNNGYELLNAAQDWINGKNREFSGDWEVKKNREAFISDMEKKGEWKTMDEEIKEMAMELEDEIFGSLMNEFMDDCFPSPCDLFSYISCN